MYYNYQEAFRQLNIMYKSRGTIRSRMLLDTAIEALESEIREVFSLGVK